MFLKIKVKNLNNYQSKFICGKLYFNQPIDSIEYTITPKSQPRIFGIISK